MSTTCHYILLRECCGFPAAANLISAIPAWSPQKSFPWVLFLIRDIHASSDSVPLEILPLWGAEQELCELWCIWDLSRKIPRTVLNILNSSKNTEPRSLSKTAHTLKGAECQDSVTYIFSPAVFYHIINKELYSVTAVLSSPSCICPQSLLTYRC